MSIFDQLRATQTPSDPERWQPSEPGDEILGILTRIDEREGRDGRAYQIAHLQLEDGSAASVSVTTVIRSELDEQNAQIGDGIRLIYRGTHKTRGGATYKGFDVTVVHALTHNTEEIF